MAAKASHWQDWEVQLLRECFPHDIPRLMRETGRSRAGVDQKAHLEGLTRRGWTSEEKLGCFLLRDDGLRPGAALRQQGAPRHAVLDRVVPLTS